MTKLATTFLLCFFIVSGTTGCRIFRTRAPAPVPPSPPTQTTETPTDKTEKEIAKENKERIKTKAQIFKEINSFRTELKKTEQSLATQRAKGVDTSQVDEIWKNSNNLLNEAERLYLEANLTENYEPVLGLLQAIEDSFEKIKEEIKKAPRFREKTKPKPKEFMDYRDIIFEKLGHIDPTHIQTGPMFSFRFSIFDPTEFLSDKCFDGNNFTLQFPPKVMIMEFNKGQEGTYQFVLIEENPGIERFTLQAILSPEQRDQALSVLCESQGSGFGNFKFLAAYKNAPVGSPEMYLEQLISGRFRFADQFGLGSLTENAKGSAALADLELVSLVFSTKIDPLSRTQHEIIDKIHEKIKDNLLLNEKLQKAFAKIESWQVNLSPKKNDKKNFLKLIKTSHESGEIEVLVNKFEDELKQLAEEFSRVQKELLRFKKDYNSELVFYDDENPVMALLLRGVGFKVEESSAGTLFKKDIPQLLVRLEFLYYRSKNDEQPPLVSDNQFKIENANKYIDVSKDYQRLTSFMLGWPLRKTLPPGHYQLKLTITDEIREKAIIQEVDFIVLPANLRGK
ncbi:MAG: hypothetical protein HYX20_01955 [Candidatus Yanofskybacteria bacterium]|nr:hypothetical protein [Candidatus Yanofskybacteria bacterium]